MPDARRRCDHRPGLGGRRPRLGRHRHTAARAPAVVDAVAPVPVVAAGGIADGRGLAAVLALGAAGAWLGTQFVMSEEAGALPAYLARLRDGQRDRHRLFAAVRRRLAGRAPPHAPQRAHRCAGRQPAGPDRAPGPARAR